MLFHTMHIRTMFRELSLLTKDFASSTTSGGWVEVLAIESTEFSITLQFDGSAFTASAN